MIVLGKTIEIVMIGGNILDRATDSTIAALRAATLIREISKINGLKNLKSKFKK